MKASTLVSAWTNQTKGVEDSAQNDTEVEVGESSASFLSGSGAFEALDLIGGACVGLAVSWVARR